MFDQTQVAAQKLCSKHITGLKRLKACCKLLKVGHDNKKILIVADFLAPKKKILRVYCMRLMNS